MGKKRSSFDGGLSTEGMAMHESRSSSRILHLEALMFIEVLYCAEMGFA